jgi:hypothetical protein
MFIHKLGMTIGLSNYSVEKLYLSLGRSKKSITGMLLKGK